MAARAAEEGIGKLYHYEKFCPPYLEDTLVNQRVHVSNPQTFNDPWDCYPCFDTTRASDPAYRARCIQYIRKFPLPNLTEAKRLSYEAATQGDSRLFTQMLHSFREPLRNMIVKRWRIYCLTPYCDRSVMWSHYSNKHQGICLELDAGQAVIGGAFRVEYRDALPALDILESSDEAAFQIFVTKSPDWSYENEYRIVARDGEADDARHPLLPITTNDFLPLPPSALTGIIAGCRADVDTIKALVEKRAPGLPVKRAVQAPDRYSLSIQE